ncbi:MAG: 50S ribosomal protein L10 [Nanoarchaeota archaeon]|nr:50S ribosomal protein L10 [Nanoarchaeota archaeon]
MTTKKVPAYKIKTVKELSDLIKNKRTVLVASIKNIPGSQFQEISKKLRGKARVKVPKKNLIYLAIDSLKDDNVKKLEEKITENFAILFSDLDSFELAGELLRNTSPAKAKPGQEAPEDIKIEEGPTDLIPGPAISELGALGIQIQIEKGKIFIKQSKIIAKKGEKISRGAADLMGKLDIKPFKIGFIPLCAFDTKEGKLYSEIDIDTKGTIAKLKEAYSRTLPFAVEIGYATEETIKFLLAKAVANARTLEKLNPKEGTSEEEKAEEKQDDILSENKSEDNTNAEASSFEGDK